MAKQVSVVQFNGRVGELVGAKTLKGNNSLRIHRATIANPNTLAQRKQRTAFLAANQTAASLPSQVLEAFMPYAKSQGMSARNAFVRLNLRNGAFAATRAGSDGELVSTPLSQSPEKVLLTAGHSTIASFNALSFENPSQVDTSFDIAGDYTPSNVIAHMLVYNEELQQYAYASTTASAATGNRLSARVPSAWNGMRVFVFIWAQNTAPTGLDANTIYQGRPFYAQSDLRSIASKSEYSKSIYAGSGTVG